MAAAAQPPPSDQRKRGEGPQPGKGALLRVHFAYPGAQALLTHPAFQVQTPFPLAPLWNGHLQQRLLALDKDMSRTFFWQYIAAACSASVWTSRVTLLCEVLVLTAVRGEQMG